MLPNLFFAFSWAVLGTSHRVYAPLEEEISWAGPDDPSPVSLCRRADYQFVGFHGTTKLNGEFYMKGPHIGIPPLFHGNDAELSPGLYVTDDVVTAFSYALSSAAHLSWRIKSKDKGVEGIDINDAKPYLCAVESSKPWSSIPKVWIPLDKIAQNTSGQNDPAVLQQQEALISYHGKRSENAVRFSLLDKTLKIEDVESMISSPNLHLAKESVARVHAQALIPPKALQSDFRMRACVMLFDQEAMEEAKQASHGYDAALKRLGVDSYPQFSYVGERKQWGILGDPI